MFVVIGWMLAGICAGFLLRSKKLGWVHPLISGLIWTLLFLLGLEVGGTPHLVASLATLGLEAALVTLAALAGSSLAAWALWHWLYRRKGGRA